MGAGKQDTLVGEKLVCVRDLRGGNGIKENVIPQKGTEIILEFDPDIRIDAKDQYAVFVLGLGHGKPPEYFVLRFTMLLVWRSRTRRCTP